MFDDIKNFGNVVRVKNWHTRADIDFQSNEPAMSFISSWIALNHIYGVYATLPSSTIGQRPGDKQQVIYFANSNETLALVNEVKQTSSISELSIQLPVKSVLTGFTVPNCQVQTVKISDIECSELFLILYQVRNNLFHGSKDPMVSSRDEELCQCLSTFLIEFNAKFIEKYF